jgi:hypothetical protein
MRSLPLTQIGGSSRRGERDHMPLRGKLSHHYRPPPTRSDDEVHVDNFDDRDSDKERLLRRLKQHSLRTKVADEVHHREKENA